MNRASPKTDVAVIGGGLIGLAIARAARLAGAEVTIVDEDPGSGASSVAAGMLAPVTEAHYGEEELLHLNLRASEMYPGWIADLEDETGLSTGYQRCGTLSVARDRDDNEALAELFRFQRGLGLRVERLDAKGVRNIEPGLAPNVRGGVLIADDHQVDPQALVVALLASCEKAGVTFLRQRCRSISIEADSVTGVEVDGRIVQAEAVIVAAGVGSAAIKGVPAGCLPIRPVKGQLLRMRALTDPVPVSVNVRGLDVYLVPRGDGRLVVGATVEEKGDTAVTAGAVHDLLRYAYELVPGIAEMEFVEAAAGLRPGTPDNAPVIGGTDIEGLFVATGHYRNGVLLAPITGRAAAAWLETGSVPPEFEPFDPHRFEAKP